MCGIAGIYQLKTQATPDPQVLAKMNDSQWHRGPDAGDYFFQPTVGLAHRRLSIIDIAGSPQPASRWPRRLRCGVGVGVSWWVLTAGRAFAASGQMSE